MAYLNMKKVQIFLIGGGMGVGKSTISHVLAKKYHIKNILSTDIIRSTLRLTLKNNILAKHSFQLSNEEFKQQSLIISPFIEELIKEFCVLGKDSIIEGINIWPSFFVKRGYEVTLVDIEDEEKHKELILNRRKDTYKNFPSDVYMENFSNIRRIRKLLINEAALNKCRIMNESCNIELW